MRRETTLRIWIALSVAAAALVAVVLPHYLRQHPAESVVRQEAKDAAPTVELAEESDAKEPAERVPADSYDRPLGKRGIGTEFGGFAAGREIGASASLADDSAPVPVESLSYVYDVPTTEAQQAVLKTFEQTLREQQIVLEEAPAPATTESESRTALSVAPAAPAAASSPTAAEETKQQEAESPQDRVYVVEAPRLQLTNTINRLESLAAQSGELGRLRQLRDLERVEDLSKRNDEQKPALEALGNKPSNVGDVQQNRSQAVRLRTGFADQRGSAGSYYYAQEPASPERNAVVGGGSQRAAGAQTTSPPPAISAGVPAATSAPAPRPAADAVENRFVVPQQQLAQPEQADRLQRAVIIFRVVPERSGEADARK
jgi:hypothetical protein